MPLPDVYEREYSYWPWGGFMARAVDWLTAHAVPNAFVFDYMCGTGHLLGALRRRRPDLRLGGCDSHLPYIEYAQRQHSGIEFYHADARTFVPSEVADVICCTSGLHHLPFPDQSKFLTKVGMEGHARTAVLVGEECLPEFGDANWERRLAALKLNSDLLNYAIREHSPDDVVDAAIEVLRGDIFCLGEFKRSISGWRSLIEESLVIESSETTWSAPSGGGDVLFVCRRSSTLK